MLIGTSVVDLLVRYADGRKELVEVTGVDVDVFQIEAECISRNIPASSPRGTIVNTGGVFTTELILNTLLLRCYGSYWCRRQGVLDSTSEGRDPLRTPISELC